MPKDHYVAQTYLRSFKIPGLKSACVNVWRKTNLQQLPAVPINSICYKIDWSSNPHFPANPRIVENFLRQIEPKWPSCVRQVSDNTYNLKTKYLIAGYLAYLRTYTPTAARLGTSMAANSIGKIYAAMEHNEYRNPNSKFKEAIEKIRQHGGVKVSVDPSYPKALGLSHVEKIQRIYANPPWLVLENKTGTPLITSDNPLAMHYRNFLDCDFYFPVTPQLAIIIRPIRDNAPRENDARACLKSEGVKVFNQLIAQSAEDLVVYNENQNVKKLVHDYCDWRVELQTETIAGLTMYQQHVAKYR